jgi:carbon monoxide dehydrogenase subunit G
MNIQGHRTLDAPRETVFAAICDPNMLLTVIPGCREIEMVRDGEYRGRISLRLPGIAGTYRTVVRLVEADAPRYGQLEGEVVGALGSIKGRVSFRLAEAGGKTTVDYDGQAVIGGPLARLDSRFVEGLAGSLIDQGLGNLNARLQVAPPAASPAASASEGQQATGETPA